MFNLSPFVSFRYKAKHHFSILFVAYSKCATLFVAVCISARLLLQGNYTNSHRRRTTLELCYIRHYRGIVHTPIIPPLCNHSLCNSLAYSILFVSKSKKSATFHFLRRSISDGATPPKPVSVAQKSRAFHAGSALSAPFPCVPPPSNTAGNKSAYIARWRQTRKNNQTQLGRVNV